MNNFRIALAENLVGLAITIKPSNYILEGEREMGQLAINGMLEMMIDAGMQPKEGESLHDLFKRYAEHYK